MAERKYFENSVVKLPEESGQAPDGLVVNAVKAGPGDVDAPVDVMFALDASDVTGRLEAIVASGQVIDPRDLNTQYALPSPPAKQLEAWLKRNGFTIQGKAADSSAIYARAPVSAIEKALQVQMVPVVQDGITYPSASSAPSLPADVGEGVHAILGLQPFRRAQKHFRQHYSRAAPNRGKLGRDGALTPNAANAPPYLVAEILKAYNADQLGVTGQGQQIAILIDTFPAASDLNAFWKANGLNVGAGQIKKINVPGGHLPAPEGEETLDASWASGIAPGAEIRIYASGSLQFSALDKALDQIIADLPANPGLRQLSISLGLGETYMGGPGGEVQAQHLRFLKLAAAGVNVFVSTGDAGSNPDRTGHSPTGPLQAEFESTDTAVVAVGGTTLALSGTGAVASEVGWSAGGGGRSILFNRPPWQAGAGIPSGSDRLVPDVCAAADPNTGAFLVFNGRPMGIGGTSWSAPVWAAFCALLNEARLKSGKAALPFLNPLLYPRLGTACFRDITAGSNGAYSAQPGYDMVTGLGAPNVAELLRQLP